MYWLFRHTCSSYINVLSIALLRKRNPVEKSRRKGATYIEIKKRRRRIEEKKKINNTLYR